MVAIDDTHDPLRRSWVASANGHGEFPIQNLPFGVFTVEGNDDARIGVAIGDSILDLHALDAAGYLADTAAAGLFAGARHLNGVMALAERDRAHLRSRLSSLLSEAAREQEALATLLRPAAAAAMRLPAVVGDYTDFYAGIHHAVNVGRLFRPDHPLLPNYKYVPIGYHGRASSVCVSSTPVRRPNGQRQSEVAPAPTFGPTQRLDFELELGVWVGAGNALGQPVSIREASRHIAGFCLLNDWSARDIQSWEYQPLGPFLAKNFATSISPWVITAEALAPFRSPQSPRDAADPQPLPYLRDAVDQQQGALDIELEVLLLTSRARARGDRPVRLSLVNTRHLYWTVAQLLAHHSSNGCNLRPGDLLGSGTISSDSADGLGSLMEMTRGGKEPIAVGDGETRTFLADGDEVIFRAHARRDGFVSIGFGDVRGTIVPAPDVQ